MARSYMRHVGLAGVYNELDDFMAGQIIFHAADTPPAGYLECDGSAVSRITYATLFGVIGSDYGAGDGATTFNLPDLRGEFVRGVDNFRGVDAGRGLGSNQTDDLKAHQHTQQTAASQPWRGDGPNNIPAGNMAMGGTLTGSAGGSETRPRNVALLPCIKYS